jgi:molybdopterin-guanine dinucleotide biosynthesis protein A
MVRDVTCVILAGGKSRRMSRDKSFIEVGGARLFDYAFGKCTHLFPELIIVTKQPKQFNDYRARIVVDEIIGAGSLGGLYTGLREASNYHTFCVACDMPFLQPRLIIHLAKKRLNYDVVIPRTRQGLEPLHAFYSKRCIEPIKKNLERGELKITKFLTEVQVGYCDEEEIKKIDPSLASFVNANTKKNLMEIQKMLNGEQCQEKHNAY